MSDTRRSANIVQRSIAVLLNVRCSFFGIFLIYFLWTRSPVPQCLVPYERARSHARVRPFSPTNPAHRAPLPFPLALPGWWAWWWCFWLCTRSRRPPPRSSCACRGRTRPLNEKWNKEICVGITCQHECPIIGAIFYYREIYKETLNLRKYTFTPLE